ncbi:MAG: hypothetical protein Q9168_004228 [Polycauliona sp. 1 TL-2023]
MRPILCIALLVPVFLQSCIANLCPQANCTSCLPNPIATIYPHNVTGTLNATTSVILVPLSYAQSLLPARFANSILTHAYTRFNIPPSVYPLIVESTIDHDIRYNNSPIAADFSTFRTTFPFIDLLGNGYSTFRYTGFIYLPPSNIVAVNGSQAYGYTVLPGYFDPPDAPYRFTSSKTKTRLLEVYSQTPAIPTPHGTTGGRIFGKLTGSTQFRPSASSPSAIPIAFYKNVTNQIQFGNYSICDRMSSYWNTSVTMGMYEPEAVVGDVLLSPPMVPRTKVFRDVQGIRATRAFLEVNYLDCEGLKGYAGTGSGDSG